MLRRERGADAGSSLGNGNEVGHEYTKLQVLRLATKVRGIKSMGRLSSKLGKGKRSTILSKTPKEEVREGQKGG